jgi:hypothetical protein
MGQTGEVILLCLFLGRVLGETNALRPVGGGQMCRAAPAPRRDNPVDTGAPTGLPGRPSDSHRRLPVTVRGARS